MWNYELISCVGAFCFLRGAFAWPSERTTMLIINVLHAGAIQFRWIGRSRDQRETETTAWNWLSLLNRLIWLLIATRLTGFLIEAESKSWQRCQSSSVQHCRVDIIFIGWSGCRLRQHNRQQVKASDWLHCGQILPVRAQVSAVNLLLSWNSVGLTNYYSRATQAPCPT